MVTPSLSDPITIINTLTEQLESLETYLRKANALTSIMLNVDDIENLPEKQIHDYFWALNDIIYDAEQFNTACINQWLKQHRELKNDRVAKASVTAV